LREFSTSLLLSAAWLAHHAASSAGSSSVEDMIGILQAGTALDIVLECSQHSEAHPHHCWLAGKGQPAAADPAPFQFCREGTENRWPFNLPTAQGKRGGRDGALPAWFGSSALWIPLREGSQAATANVHSTFRLSCHQFCTSAPASKAKRRQPGSTKPQGLSVFWG